LVVVAINDYRPLSIKLSGALTVEVFEEDVDGSRKVLFFVFRLGKYLNHLRSL
jgi:hypothetical protein